MGDDNKNSIPLIYLYIYKKFVEHIGYRETQTKKILEILRRVVYQVPKKYHHLMLKEMEEYKLIKKLNMQKFQILKSKENELKRLDNYIFW